jgi:hypothetical protein
VSLLPIAKALIIIGFTFLFMGILFIVIAKVFPKIIIIPGNFYVERENIRCIFALGASILISMLLTVGINFLFHIINRLR